MYESVDAHPLLHRLAKSVPVLSPPKRQHPGNQVLKDQIWQDS